MSSLVEITDLERRGDDVRRRQRGCVLKERSSIRITRGFVCSVVFANRNNYASGGKGMDIAGEEGSRGRNGFPFDGLNLRSWQLLAR